MPRWTQGAAPLVVTLALIVTLPETSAPFSGGLRQLLRRDAPEVGLRVVHDAAATGAAENPTSPTVRRSVSTEASTTCPMLALYR